MNNRKPKYKKLDVAEYENIKNSLKVARPTGRQSAIGLVSKLLNRDFKVVQLVNNTNSFAEYRKVGRENYEIRKRARQALVSNSEKNVDEVKKNSNPIPHYSDNQQSLFPTQKVNQVSLGEFLGLFAAYLPKFVGILNDMRKSLARNNELLEMSAKNSNEYQRFILKIAKGDYLLRKRMVELSESSNVEYRVEQKNEQ